MRCYAMQDKRLGAALEALRKAEKLAHAQEQLVSALLTAVAAHCEQSRAELESARQAIEVEKQSIFKALRQKATLEA